LPKMEKLRDVKNGVFRNYINRLAVFLTVVGFFIFVFNITGYAENKPSKRNLKQDSELLNLQVNHPSKFKVDYTLRKMQSGKGKGFSAFGSKTNKDETKAEIAVNILDSNFHPIRTYVLRDIKKIKNTQTLWDGRDMHDREMPSGDYYASLSIIYSDGKKETKFFRFKKND